VQKARIPQRSSSGLDSSHSGVDFEAHEPLLVRHKSGADFTQAWAYGSVILVVWAPNFTLRGPIFTCLFKQIAFSD
jgi:hypothetical protein